MGLVFPIAGLLIALSAITVVVGISASWVIPESAAYRQRLEQAWFVSTIILACFPAALSVGGFVDGMSLGDWSLRPLVLLLATISMPVIAGIKYFEWRKARKKRGHNELTRIKRTL